MYQRKVIDIAWEDLVQGLKFHASCPPRERLLKEISNLWSDGRAVLPCLSVRTGFDLLLSCLALEPGAEVIMTSVTIPHMEQILREHGLVPIPVDFDPQDMQTSARSVEQAITSKTCAVMITHLFGTRQPLDAFVDLVRAHDLLLFEDCAQAFDGLGYAGDVQADISMFSFGSIKSATALGGAILSVRDWALAARMRAAQERYPEQDSSAYLKKLLQYMAMHCLSRPERFSLLTRSLTALGQDYDLVVRKLTRGFSGPGFWERIRHRMCTPHLAMLHHRLMTYDTSVLEQRGRAGRFFASLLEPHVMHFGWRCARHTHWLFPIAVANPDEVITALRARGFDATSGSSTLIALETPEHEQPPGFVPRASQQLMRHVVYLPISQHIPEHELVRAARALNDTAKPLQLPAPAQLFHPRQASKARPPKVII